MDLPIHQPYENGKGGVEIGLRPIEVETWLERDKLFSTEIKEKKKLFLEKKDEVLMICYHLPNVHLFEAPDL